MRFSFVEVTGNANHGSPPSMSLRLKPPLAYMDKIETERLRLRMFTLADLPDLFRLFSDPEVVRYIGSGLPAAYEETETALLSMIKHWERHGFGRWAMLDKTNERLIGYAGLRSLEGKPELVYLLDREYWGRGLATEAARACLKYGFEHHRFEQIVAIVKPPNRASRHVLEKIGLRYEQEITLYNMLLACYALKREEYQPLDFLYRLQTNNCQKPVN